MNQTVPTGRVPAPRLMNVCASLQPFLPGFILSCFLRCKLLLQAWQSLRSLLFPSLLVPPPHVWVLWSHWGSPERMGVLPLPKSQLFSICGSSPPVWGLPAPRSCGAVSPGAIQWEQGRGCRSQGSPGSCPLPPAGSPPPPGGLRCRVLYSLCRVEAELQKTPHVFKWSVME